MLHTTAIGNLGKDAETKTLQSGKVVCNFSIATKGRDKDAPTIWVDCAMWGERGKRVAEYLKKGARVAVSGTLGTREYNQKTYLTLDVQELELLGGKSDSKPTDLSEATVADAPF